MLLQWCENSSQEVGRKQQQSITSRLGSTAIVQMGSDRFLVRFPNLTNRVPALGSRGWLNPFLINRTYKVN